MFLQTCTPGAGCGGFSIACKRRKRPDGFLNIYGQNSRKQKTGAVSLPYQDIQPFQGLYVYHHGIGKVFNLYTLIRLVTAAAAKKAPNKSSVTCPMEAPKGISRVKSAETPKPSSP